MIPESARKEISAHLGSQPRPYLVPSLEGGVKTDCDCWDLPPLKEEDKPIHLRYQEITARILRMREEDEDDPRTAPLLRQAHELLEGVRVTRKYGTSVISMRDLLELDKGKGIRKEWWELRGSFVSTPCGSSSDTAERKPRCPAKRTC